MVLIGLKGAQIAPPFFYNLAYGFPMGATVELLSMTREAADRAGVPFELLAGLVQTESAWDPRAQSKVGALGLTQVMPWWLTSSRFKDYGVTPADLLKPDIALWIGSEILADELKRYGGDWALASMAYNGGSPMVNRAIRDAGTRDPEAVSAQLKSGETKSYWQKVRKWAGVFAGQVSEIDAQVTEVAQDAKAFVEDNTGTVLGILVLLGMAIMGGRRG